MTQLFTLHELLLDTLQDLGQKDFKLFKWHLCQDVLLEFIPFRKACLEELEREDTVTKMMERYLRDGAVQMTVAILKKMNQNDLAEKLEEETKKLPTSPVRDRELMTEDRTIAKKNLSLMKRVKVVDRIAKALLSKGFIQDDMYCKICSASTSVEKIWHLMKALNAGGSSAKTAFIDTLNEIEPHLLEDQDEEGQTRRLQEMSLVLLGKTGAGKSSAGNTILGKEEFKINGGMKQCVACKVEVDGRQVTVVDTPGWKGKSVKDYMEKIVPDIKKSVSELPAGPKAHLVVVPVSPMNDTYISKMEKHLEHLSESDWETAMVLFTHGDQLKQTTIEQHMDSHQALQAFVEKCDNKYHVLNNNDRDDHTQVTQLLEKIEKMLLDNVSGHLNQIILEEESSQQEEKQDGKKGATLKFWGKNKLKQEEEAEKMENTPKEETNVDQKVEPVTAQCSKAEAKQSNSKSGLLSIDLGKFTKPITPKTSRRTPEEDNKDTPQDVQTKGETKESSLDVQSSNSKDKLSSIFSNSAIL